MSIALVELAKRETDAASRQFICDTLVSLGADAEPAAPILIEMLRSNLVADRWIAARLLGSIGPGAREALPKLERMVKDEDLNVSRIALWAIDQIRRPD